MLKAPNPSANAHIPKCAVRILHGMRRHGGQTRDFIIQFDGANGLKSHRVELRYLGQLCGCVVVAKQRNYSYIHVVSDLVIHQGHQTVIHAPIMWCVVGSNIVEPLLFIVDCKVVALDQTPGE